MKLTWRQLISQLSVLSPEELDKPVVISSFSPMFNSWSYGNAVSMTVNNGRSELEMVQQASYDDALASDDVL